MIEVNIQEIVLEFSAISGIWSHQSFSNVWIELKERIIAENEDSHSFIKLDSVGPQSSFAHLTLWTICNTKFMVNDIKRQNSVEL